MRAAAIALVLASAACATEPSTEPTTGNWKRRDEQGRVISHLELERTGEGTGNFWSSSEDWPGSGTASASGIYHLVGDRLTLRGTNGAGEAIYAGYTYYADDANLVLGAYVPDPDGGMYSYFEWGHESAPDRAWTVRPGLARNVDGFVVGWIDPISGRQKADGGDLVTEPTGDLVFQSFYRFRSLGDGAALARVEPYHRLYEGIAYDPVDPWDVTMTYDRTP
jgi:hypothetical protein